MFTQLRESFAYIQHRMGKSVALSLMFLLSAPLWCQSTARAEVIITEIMANPETGTEWVELTTIGEETENISNFKLYDVVSSPSLLVTFPENTVLTAGVATIIEIYPDKLNNTGDGLTLYDTTGTVRTQVNFGQSTRGLSWQRTLQSATYFLETPTPGQFVAVAATPPSPSPTVAPSLSPIVTLQNATTNSETPNAVPTQTNITPEEKNEATPPEPSPRQLELEKTITTLLQRHLPKTIIFLTRDKPDLTTPTIKPNRKQPDKQKHITPKLSAFFLVVGGILISSASYAALYVLEQKEISA